MILRARGWLPRFGRTKVDPYEGSGTKTGNGGGGSVETGGAVEVSGPSQDRGKRGGQTLFWEGGSWCKKWNKIRQTFSAPLEADEDAEQLVAQGGIEPPPPSKLGGLPPGSRA